jgi:hypothetical protein
MTSRSRASGSVVVALAGSLAELLAKSGLRHQNRQRQD